MSSVSFHQNTQDMSSLAKLMKGKFSLKGEGADDGLSGQRSKLAVSTAMMVPGPGMMTLRY